MRQRCLETDSQSSRYRPQPAINQPNTTLLLSCAIFRTARLKLRCAYQRIRGRNEYRRGFTSSGWDSTKKVCRKAEANPTSFRQRTARPLPIEDLEPESSADEMAIRSSPVESVPTTPYWRVDRIYCGSRIMCIENIARLPLCLIRCKIPCQLKLFEFQPARLNSGKISF